eukprot:11502493-Karenia_brevis.AAC.1
MHLWKLRGCLSDPWRADNAMAQGCGISITGANLQFAVLAVRVLRCAPAVISSVSIYGNEMLRVAEAKTKQQQQLQDVDNAIFSPWHV